MLTPATALHSSAAFRSSLYVYAAVSSTRFAALANIPSASRRIRPDRLDQIDRFLPTARARIKVARRDLERRTSRKQGLQHQPEL